MVISCCAYNCTNRQTTSKMLSFHRVPLNNPKLLKQWKLAIRRKDWEPTKTSLICSEHFTDDDYVVKKSASVRPRLKPDAVPSIFDFPDNYNYMKKEKQRILAEKLEYEKQLLINHKKMCVSHDHSYGNSSVHKVSTLASEIDKIKNKYKLIFEKAKGKKKTIQNLRSLIHEMTVKNMIIPELEDILSNNLAMALKIMKME